MKRLTASVLLFIFLFNIGGHQLAFRYFIYRSDNILNEQISKNRYNPSELVEIKIPVRLSTVCNWEDYEPISGQVQLSGNCYNYVKMKITRDTMFLMVIPNYEKTRLIGDNIIYAKQVSDSPLNKKSHGTLPKTTESASKYHYQLLQFVFMPPVSDTEKRNVHYPIPLDHPYLSVNGQPPEAIV